MSFTLHTNDVLSTVLNVLKSCSLPIEHMRGLKATTETSKRPPEAGVPFYRPIKWDKSYYTFTGFRDPEQELQQARRVEVTLRLVPLDPSSVSQFTTKCIVGLHNIEKSDIATTLGSVWVRQLHRLKLEHTVCV